MVDTQWRKNWDGVTSQQCGLPQIGWHSCCCIFFPSNIMLLNNQTKHQLLHYDAPGNAQMTTQIDLLHSKSKRVHHNTQKQHKMKSNCWELLKIKMRRTRKRTKALSSNYWIIL